MAYDALTMRAVIFELADKIIDGRISKIYQPSRHEVLLHIRKSRESYKLRLSSHPQQGGVYITEDVSENPQDPPMFCMLLRKHVEGGRIISISQIGLERIFILEILTRDETGTEKKRRLIAEIMGKHSNLILVQEEENVIVDSIKRVPEQVSRRRQVLPGISYQWPPPQNRDHPFDASQETILENLRSRPLNEKASRSLLVSYEGLGPLSAKEIITRAGIDPDAKRSWLKNGEEQNICRAFLDFFKDMEHHQYQPSLAIDPGEKKALAYAPYVMHQYPFNWQTSFPSMNSLLSRYFIYRQETDRLEEMKRVLEKKVRQGIEKQESKISKIETALAKAEKADELRAYGEIILAHAHLIQKGDNTISGPDYTKDPQKNITVPIEPNLTPAENAQAYFRRYQKAKRSRAVLEKQLRMAQRELSYLENTEQTITDANSVHLLKETRAELIEQGYIKEKKKRKEKKRKKEAPSKPMEIQTDHGFLIMVGRNNRQNDLLTMKTAQSNDLWLHAKDIPGSHVVVRRRGEDDIPKEIIEKAASIAAYFSKARSAGKVPVDYTLKKHVRKPKGAKPGMVIYDHQKTILAEPREPK